MYDGTNRPEEGSVHGDFYQEIYRLLGHDKKLAHKFVNRYGPICEVADSGGKSPRIPLIPFFNNTNPANTSFLRDTVHAEKLQRFGLILMINPGIKRGMLK